MSLAAVAAQQLFRAKVIGVGVPVSVWQGRQPSRDLVAADFHLTDNGVTQEIVVVDGAAVPLDVTIILQESELVQWHQVGTFTKQLEAAVDALRSGDRLTVVLAGDDQRQLGVPLGVDLEQQAKAEQRCQPVYDALARALVRSSNPDQQRVIVVISMGEGNGSFLDHETVLDLAKRSRARLFILSAERRVGQTTYRNAVATSHCPSLEVDWSENRRTILRNIERIGSPDEQVRQLWIAGKERLVAIAAQTGGREIRATALTNSVVGPIRDALDEIRAGYIVRYVPTGVPDNGWHQISVTIKRSGRYEVRARPGFLR
jgi:VWFA-related protein